MTVLARKKRIEAVIHDKIVKNEELKNFLYQCVDKFPGYFWTAPASVQKYHYPDEREDGGLVLHTLRLCKLTEDMVRFHQLNYWENNVLIASCILHDSFARGVPPKDINISDPLHPIYVGLMFPYNAFADRFLPGKEGKLIYEEIMECVTSHLGQWSPARLLHSNRKLPSIFQTIDYIGSRTYIKVDISDND